MGAHGAELIAVGGRTTTASRVDLRLQHEMLLEADRLAEPRVIAPGERDRPIPAAYTSGWHAYQTALSTAFIAP